MTKVAAGVLALLTTTSCNTQPAHPLKYSASPNGEYKAVVLKQAGGITTRTSWFLEVLRTSEEIGGRASPLVIQTPYYTYGLTTNDLASITRIDIQWISDDSLVASIDSRAKITVGMRDFGGGTRLRQGVPDSVRLVVKKRSDMLRRL